MDSQIYSPTISYADFGSQTVSYEWDVSFPFLGHLTRFLTPQIEKSPSHVFDTSHTPTERSLARDSDSLAAEVSGMASERIWVREENAVSAGIFMMATCPVWGAKTVSTAPKMENTPPPNTNLRKRSQTLKFCTLVIWDVDIFFFLRKISGVPGVIGSRGVELKGNPKNPIIEIFAVPSTRAKIQG